MATNKLPGASHDRSPWFRARSSPWWMAVALLMFVANPLGAAPRDQAAEKQMRQAMDQFKKKKPQDAERTLLQVIGDCGDQCSPPVVARAWMYIGVVRADNNPDGAKDAFGGASTFDPNVKLDPAYSTPALQQLFTEATSLEGDEEEEAEEPLVPLPSGPDALKCTEPPRNVQTRRPIPVECNLPPETRGINLIYADEGGDFRRTPMKREGKTKAFRATIPCSETQQARVLKWYAQAVDADQNVITEYGSQSSAREISLKESTRAEPPAFPKTPPPARCAPLAAAKGTWGAVCATDQECGEGLHCLNGTCERGLGCESDSDCKGGYCSSGQCEKLERGQFVPIYNWVGIVGSLDFLTVGGQDVCRSGSEDSANFDCALNGVEYNPVLANTPNAGGEVSSGFVPGTGRLLAAFERIVPLGSQTFAVEGRGGIILGGTTGGNVGFTPYHGELGLKYYFGNQPFRTSALRPFIGVGGGFGGSSRDTDVETLDCAYLLNPNLEINPEPPDRPAFIAQQIQQCVNQPGTALNPPRVETPTASERFGPWFVSGSIGAMYALFRNNGPYGELQGAYFVSGGAGFALRPTIGYRYGF